MQRNSGNTGKHGADGSRNYPQFLRKPSRAELLGLATAMGGLLLVLAMGGNAVVEIVALFFELEIMTVSTALLIAFVMLIAVAAVGIAYGFGLDSRTGRSGKLHDLYRHRRPHYGRRPR